MKRSTLKTIGLGSLLLLAINANDIVDGISSAFPISDAITQNVKRSIYVALFVVIVLIGIRSIFGFKKKEQIPSASRADLSFGYARPQDIPDIVALDKTYFEKGDVIPEFVFSTWLSRNARTFTCLYEDGRVIGYFSILPVKPETFSRFVNGEIAETDFAAEDILTDNEISQLGANLYVFSIVVREESRHSGLTYRELERRVADEIQRYQDLTPVNFLYAAAASDAGRNKILQHGFLRVVEACDRADGHDLYQLDVTDLDDFRSHIRAVSM
ncbi:MAG: hypothetical protein AAF004_10075 [Pseudomonadota bacterium]